MNKLSLAMTLVGVGLSFGACSITTTDGTTGQGDCEVICKNAESVKCGGATCLDQCNADRSSAPDTCKSAGDAYYSCARNAKSVSCSGGLLSHYGCSDLEAAFFQCIHQNGTGGSGSTSSSTTTGTTASTGVTSSSSTGAGYVCDSAQSQSGMACPDATPDNCVCFGCNTTACTAETDCVCPICATDNFCSRHCSDDGVCNPFFENCQCADCIATPVCH